jgi:phenylacetate-CoA ligase
VESDRHNRAMQAPYILVRSALPGVAWPAITGPQEATALALQYQLERSQWLSPADLRALQLRQLDALVRHAWLTVPFYRWQWHGSYRSADALDHERFERLPLLTRESLQHEFEELRSKAPPAAHGAISDSRTAGTTGRPVRALKTALTHLWWQVLMLRDHLWRRRDFDGTLASIRAGLEEREAQGWEPVTRMLAATGRSVALGLPASVDAQLEWLRRHAPDYLQTSPANAAALARASIEHGIRFPALREVRTSGEPVSAETRALCREAWGVPVTDLYGADEAGCIALQCPAHEHYHVQSESVLVEVLDAKDRSCSPGMVGRVVVTTLQNFAMPLVRYDIGDLAEVGDPCPCGRGLPVLRRIAGRVSDTPVARPGSP